MSNEQSELPPPISIDDIAVFFQFKEIPTECSQCGKDKMVLLTGLEDESMFMLRIPHQNKKNLEFVGVSCAFCGYTRFFEASIVRYARSQIPFQPTPINSEEAVKEGDDE